MRVRQLFVAPYPGEFGWELMNWQGRVRWLAQHGGYDRVVVCARPDRRPLYKCAGGSVVFCPMPSLDLPGEACDDHRIDSTGAPIARDCVHSLLRGHVESVCPQLGLDAANADFLLPGKRSQLWPTDASAQLFVSLRRPAALTADVVLVPRLRHLAGERNREQSWWDELADRLRRSGLVVEMYEPRLDRAVDQLSRTRLAVGASTGGLHLASLCRCPHYVWGAGPEARWTAWQITNRQRYETVWNPLATPCIYDECGWQPSIDHVYAATRRALERIGLRSPREATRPGFKARWALRRRFARILNVSGGGQRWPWRVQRLVRERLV